MTSIVGVTALQEIRKFKGFESAIIAGGFIRDSIMGGEIKDLDIFISCVDIESFRDTVEQHFHVEKKETPTPQTYRMLEKDFDDWFRIEHAKGPNPWNIYKFISEKDDYGVDHINAVEIVKGSTPIITPDIGNFKGLTFNKNGYRKISPKYIGRYDCRYMDFLDVDIVGFHSENGLTKDFNGNVVDNFGKELISEFSYNIDKVYYDTETHQSEEFLRDLKNNEATLCKLADLYDLPHAMKKFERLRIKYPNFAFRSTVLELKKEEDNPYRKYKFDTSPLRKSYTDYRP